MLFQLGEIAGSYSFKCSGGLEVGNGRFGCCEPVSSSIYDFIDVIDEMPAWRARPLRDHWAHVEPVQRVVHHFYNR